MKLQHIKTKENETINKSLKAGSSYASIEVALVIRENYGKNGGYIGRSYRVTYYMLPNPVQGLQAQDAKIDEYNWIDDYANALATYHYECVRLVDLIA